MPRLWVPNALTVANLAAGLTAILLTIAEQWALAVALVFGAAMFDSLDGRVARRLNVASEFGKQLDSLADLVSFGVAPALLAYQLVFADSGWGGYALATVFPICGALRLARFNVSGTRGHFVGLPITAAGPVLAACAYFVPVLPVTGQAFVLLILSGLMVSTVKVPKL
ncbi:CDP-diacylglycerol--serine O-phosphatidyltransferase [Anaeroselena agilis]|uniref:CDP-diacylglycerol--serine O-phosphatidyltransferase n=1 Tax=Anaeroselena agilis TaxID=3063788 RepID=A0ABU3P173_9FIRM|nr:CDP-diacylglycerol--serine O-phosphatidyltransferase [Selenomonadales bacterium 4137-cl]